MMILERTQSLQQSLKKQEGSYSEISGNYGLSMILEIELFMPTSGSILHFGQSLPLFADKIF